MATNARPRLLWGLIGVGAAFVIVGTLFWLTAPDPESLAAAGEVASAIEIRTLEVVPVVQHDRADLSGVLEPRRSVRLFSETHGRVLELGAEALDRVGAEQVLLQVDPLRARVALERAQAAVTRVHSELALARTSLERQQSLRDREVTSDSAFDDAENRERVAVSAIRDARAQLEQARDDLAKKTIRAPFDGVLRSFEVELGEYVREGQELGELLDLSAARVTLGLTGKQIVGIEAGAAVEVELEAHPNERFVGEILRVGAAAEEGSKKFPVEIEIDNPDRRLLPGMVARVALDLDHREPRLLVPREAVASEFGLGFVYVVALDEEGVLRARRRRVATRDLPFDLGQVEIASGLRAGERVAVSGVHALRDGMQVRSRGVAASAPRALDGGGEGAS